MSKHTPLPWKVEERMNVFAIAHEGGNDVCVLFFHQEHEGQPCGSIQSQDKTAEEIKANAALIARAVNAHDDLVDALNNAKNVIAMALKNGAWSADPRDLDSEDSIEEVESVLEDARAAIAAAEAKSATGSA